METNAWVVPGKFMAGLVVSTPLKNITLCYSLLWSHEAAERPRDPPGFSRASWSLQRKVLLSQLG